MGSEMCIRDSFGGIAPAVSAVGPALGGHTVVSHGPAVLGAPTSTIVSHGPVPGIVSHGPTIVSHGPHPLGPIGPLAPGAGLYTEAIASNPLSFGSGYAPGFR